jgi:hypothetical protein
MTRADKEGVYRNSALNGLVACAAVGEYIPPGSENGMVAGWRQEHSVILTHISPIEWSNVWDPGRIC